LISVAIDLRGIELPTQGFLVCYSANRAIKGVVFFI
jgi:hypothetical protein